MNGNTNQNQQDPLAMFRPQYENEKPDVPDNDPLFSFRPESLQKTFKQPVKQPIYEPSVEALPGGESPWWQKFGQGLALQSRMSKAIEPQASPTALKAGLSGATFGGSELIPGLEVGEEYPEIAEAYKLGGSLESIGALNKLFSGPLVKLAEKSPYFTKSLQSLADILGWTATGASDKTIKDAFQGKMPEFEDVLAHGAEWGALDAALKVGGKALNMTGLPEMFSNWLLGKAESTKQPPWKVVNDLLTDMKKEGINVSQTDRVTARVLSELKPGEEYIPIDKVKSAKEISLSKEPLPEAAEQIGVETLGTAPKRPPASPFGQTPPASPEYEMIPHEQRVDLSTRKIEPVQFERISANSEALSEPYKPGEIDTQKAMQSIGRSRADELVESVGERAPSEKKFGENIKADIERSFEEAEKVYEPIYTEVNEAAKNITHRPTKTIQLVNDILDQINALKTKPEGYAKVINTLNDTLQDMGYHVVEMKGKALIRDAVGNSIKLKDFAIQEDVPLSKTMELARRLNKIADYDIVGPSIKNTLKRPASSLKSEIKEALKAADPELHKKFMQAEKSYAETAKKFGTDAVTGIRGQQATEKVATKILEPTTLDNLKKIVNPAQYNEIQREILQHLMDMSFDKANRTYRELSPFLDKNAQDAARSIISHKAPHGKFAPVKELKSGIITDLNKAFTTGQRPGKVLDLWKTVQGQKLIEEALEGTPNKKQVLEYLRKQSFYDFASSVVDKTGEINFKKLNEYMKDPATVRNLNLIGGEEAVKFFRSLQNMSNGIKFNINMLERLPKVELRPGKYQLGEEKLIKAAERAKAPTEEVSKFKEIYPAEKPEKVTRVRGEQRLKEAARARQPFKFKLEEFLDDYGLYSVTSLLKTLGIIKYTKTFGGALGLEVGAKKLYRMATNPSSRKSIKKLLDTSKTAQDTLNITPLMATMLEIDEDLSD
jgi:hypothetical protein